MKQVYKTRNSSVRLLVKTKTKPEKFKYISSVESQKGVIADQRCSVENQKGAIAIDFVQR